MGGKVRMTPRVLGKKNLGRLKVPDNYNVDKDEGYDGHLQWDGDSEKVLCMQWEFCEKISKFRETSNSSEVMMVFELLGVMGSEAQMEHMCNLLHDQTSAEPLKEALLTAICIGNRPLVELILSLFKDFPHEERSGCVDSEAYLPHITPLMLACILNNFAIVECLLLRGHSIDLPHHKTCKCDVCLRTSNANIDSIRKVDAFRALSSEAFLWLATDDPFAATCAIARDIEQCLLDDNLEFMDSYRALHGNVQRFANRLVDQNWRVEELDIFLSHKCHSASSVCNIPYPRVQMALDAQLRNFAGSANVQRSMASVWWRGWGNFGSSPARDAYRVLRHMFFYPIIALLYIITGGKLGKSFSVPLARYISYMASYFSFLIALVIIRFAKVDLEVKSAHNQRSDVFLNSLECYFYLYILGMMVERYLQFCKYGFRSYFAFWWRWFDFLLIGVFMLAIHLWLTGMLVPMEDDIVELHRRHWSSWDYFLLYDIFLCTGCILAIWKIFYFFQLIKGLGGSVISVGRCISTVYNYLIVMGVIMFSFAVGINLLVQPYLGNVETRDGVTKTMGSHFKDIGFTFRNLYWAFYGYLDPQLYPLIVGNSGPNQIPVDHFITSFAIECIISLYHGIIIVTLLNLMVSLLVKKADEVLENEESEFKYTRIVIYSEFLDWSSAVPPPFNLLLIIKQLFVCLMSRNYEMCWPEIFIDRSIIKPKPEIAEKDCAVYEHLMLKLFSRFRASKECHYKTIYRTEFDKDKQSETLAKVAFMNSTHREIDPAFKLRNMKTKNGSKIVVLPSTNPICKTTRRA